jgi:hypothetical protein
MSLLLTSPLAASDSALVIREDIENRVARAGGERGSLSIQSADTSCRKHRDSAHTLEFLADDVSEHST